MRLNGVKDLNPRFLLRAILPRRTIFSYATSTQARHSRHSHYVTQRGNYRQQVFFRDEDRRLYLSLLRDHSQHFGISVLAWCLVPNHVHLIATPHHPKALAQALRQLHSDYARALHLRLGRRGHLWQARYHSVPLDEPHRWAVRVYVEQNPTRGGLAAQPWEWRWSSAQAHVGMADHGLLDTALWRRHYTGEAWRRCLEFGLADRVRGAHP